MREKEKGLYEKYYVERTDGKNIDGGCIVLEWSDPIARVGIAAFSQAVRNAGYKALADDLDYELEEYHASI